MKFIEELVVEEFLPTFRSLLAERLREEGLTQSEVAELVGISQSAVSKYVHGDIAHSSPVREDDSVQELVSRLAGRLAAGEMTPAEALVETEVTIRELERGGVLAELHEQAVPELAEMEGAHIHDPEGRLRAAGQVRASVRRGLRVLRNTPGFGARIPAVGSNLVESLPEAKTIEDVAGVPGRILAVRGEITVPDEPAFGVSQHVAGVLLAAQAAGNDARAALNVAYDEETVAALRAAGHVAVEFDPEEDIETATRAAAAEPAVSVLYQTGAMGIEPIVYVLGPDAPTVAERVRAIC